MCRATAEGMKRRHLAGDIASQRGGTGHRAARSGTVPVRFQPHRDRRGLAPRQRDRLVAARPDGRCALPAIPNWRSSPAGSRTRARGAGRSRRRSMKGAGAGAHRGALRALQLARRGRLRRQMLSAMRHEFGGHVEKTSRMQERPMTTRTPTRWCSSAPPATSPTRRSSPRSRRWPGAAISMCR